MSSLGAIMTKAAMVICVKGLCLKSTVAESYGDHIFSLVRTWESGLQGCWALGMDVITETLSTVLLQPWAPI